MEEQFLRRLGTYAKDLCSAVYITGREADEAFRNSGPSESLRKQLTYYLDREFQRVTFNVEERSRSAQFYGSQGCIIHPPDVLPRRVLFTPVPVKTALAPASSLAWPMGDAFPSTAVPTGINHARVREAIDLAFADPAALTAAVVVLHKGQLVGERYMRGIGIDTQLESWSMGKSLAATLLAVLIRDGVYSLEQPAPIPEWSSAGDPRSAIRIMDLLRMSSGLRFSSSDDPDCISGLVFPDHELVYTGDINVFNFAASVPAEFAPNTVGRYRNCDPLLIGSLIKSAVMAGGEEYLSFPQRALFDRIGIRRQVIETDAWGNMILTGFDYGTARNWARLGLLYAQDGVWQGERILPEGWTKFVSTPAPAWPAPIYGGQFWLNGTRNFPIPDTAYYMAGAGGQYTFIIPSHDLVVVRMGHTAGTPKHGAPLAQMLTKLMQEVPANQ